MYSQLTEKDFSAEPMETTATSSFPSQRVFRIDKMRLELKPSPRGMEIFASALILVGIAVSLYIWFFTDFSQKKMYAGGALICFSGGAMGVFGGCVLTRWWGTYIRFDKTVEQIRISGLRFRPPTVLWMKDVAGIQLLYLGKKCPGDSSRRRIYQLNFIIRKGHSFERLHLLECGKLSLMENLGRTSAEFLGVPYFNQVEDWRADKQAS